MLFKKIIKKSFNSEKTKRFLTWRRFVSEFEFWLSGNHATDFRYIEDWDLKFYIKNFYNWYHFYLFFINFNIYCDKKNIKINWRSPDAWYYPYREKTLPPLLNFLKEPLKIKCKNFILFHYYPIII